MPIFTVGAAGTTSSGYEVANSLRFDNPSDDTLSRTQTAGDRQTYTFSVWIKRAKLGTYLNVMGTNSEGECLRLESSNALSYFFNGSASGYLVSNDVFRDDAAWYHIVVAVDTTQATDSDRVNIYVNNRKITSFSSETYPSLNQENKINQNGETFYVGNGHAENSSREFDGYMAEVVMIDGQQLTPSSFGESDEDSGIWKPIDVSGLTFGTNGFYLDFESSGSLGSDVSGNSNDFTVNNLTAIDQSTDTPTNNFCTLNSISEHNDSTFSDGNLTYTGSAAAVHNAIGSIGVTQGKWYFEAKRVTGNSAYPFAGAFKTEGTMGSYLGATVDGWTILMDAADNGEWRNNGTLSGTSAGTFINGSIAMVAIDMDNGKIWFGKDGTWAASGNPSAGTGEQYSNLTGTIVPAVAVYTGASISLNFGSPPYTISSGNSDGNGHGNFEYAVPSGFYSLNTKNLSEFG